MYASYPTNEHSHKLYIDNKATHPNTNLLKFTNILFVIFSFSPIGFNMCIVVPHTSK